MSTSPSLADTVSSVFWWEEKEEEEQRARAIDGAIGLEASSIMIGHRWAYATIDFLVCWKNAWGTRARNGQRRTITSIVSGGDDDCPEA